MKTIKQFLMLVLLVLTGLAARAEQKIKVRTDTIRIRFENSLLEVASFSLNNNTLEQANIAEKMNALYSEMKKVNIPKPEKGERIRIRLSDFPGGKKQEFSELELVSEKVRNRELIVSEGQLLEKDFGNFLLETEDENYLVRLYLSLIHI